MTYVTFYLHYGQIKRGHDREIQWATAHCLFETKLLNFWGHIYFRGPLWLYDYFSLGVFIIH